MSMSSVVKRRKRAAGGAVVVRAAMTELLESRLLLAGHGNDGGGITGTPQTGSSGVTLNIAQLNDLQNQAGDGIVENPDSDNDAADVREARVPFNHQPGSPKVSSTGGDKKNGGSA